MIKKIKIKIKPARAYEGFDIFTSGYPVGGAIMSKKGWGFVKFHKE